MNIKNKTAGHAGIACFSFALKGNRAGSPHFKIVRFKWWEHVTFATLAFWPFGKEIVYGNGMFSFLVNLIRIIFFGWEMALGNLIVGCIWCITIVGIPFGKQFFKMARLSFMPFGASVIG
jgi:uncharacterized membrane protein YccF (DUF307 family)